MNETTTGPSTPSGPPPGPAAGPTPGPPYGSAPHPGGPRPPHQDLDRLRRSVDDRYIAGVAGGVGRHFGIDPTVIRVLLAVLTFFGGAGVVIYGVCWLFVPEEGDENAPIHVGNEPRKLLLLAAAAIAFLLAVGDAFSGFDSGWWIASLAVVIAVVLIARDRKDDRRRSASTTAAAWVGAPLASDGTPSAPAAPSGSGGWVGATAVTDGPGWVGDAGTDAGTDDGSGPPSFPPAPPAWQPPRPPAIPPRAKRTGVIWFWPALALIAMALGTIGVIDAGSADITPGVYPATALAITGVMLLIGSAFGRPGGLIFLGFVSALATAVATVVGGFHFDGRTIEVAPTAAAAVQPVYDVHNGRIELDLTRVADQQQLAGRTIEVSLGAGEIVVIVPRSLNVDIDAELGFAGGIKVPGYDGGGVQDSVERHLVGTPANPAPALELVLDATVGQITVEQR